MLLVQLDQPSHAMQALISAVFSIVFQAIAQGFFPRFHVQHTSDHVSFFCVLLGLLCMHEPADHGLKLSKHLLCVFGG